MRSSSSLPPCPLFFQDGRVAGKYMRYTMAPVILVIGAPLVLIRFVLVILGSLVFVALAFLVSLGTDPTKPLPPARDKFCVGLFRWYSLYISAIAGYFYRVKNEQLAHHRDAPVVVANHSSIMDAVTFSLKCFGHPVGKEGVLNNWAVRQIFLAARVVIVRRPPSAEMRELLQLYTSPSASEAEIISLNPQDENIPPCDAEKIAKYQKLLERRKAFGIAGTSEILWNRVHDKENQWKQIVLFPEGTITPATCFTRFKTGAFRLNVPVQPVTVRYRSILSTCWLSDNVLFNIYKILANPITLVDLEFHEPMSCADGETPRAFADRVGKYMASALGAIYTNYTNDDMLYFYGYKDISACTEEWIRDYGWMQRLTDFSTRFKINSNFGIDQAFVDKCYSQHIKEKE